MLAVPGLSLAAFAVLLVATCTVAMGVALAAVTRITVADVLRAP